MTDRSKYSEALTAGPRRRTTGREVLLFSTARYAPMADDLAALTKFPRGEVERFEFPDGEHYRRLMSDPRGCDVVLLGGTIDDTDTLEMYDLACALVHAGVHTLTLMIPWYGYQTMERAVKRGEVVVAKTRARMLSSIPIAGSGNRVVLVDLHSEGITQYFTGNIWPVHLYAKPLILPMLRRLANPSMLKDKEIEGAGASDGARDFVLASTDAGRAKWVESLANDLGVDAGFVFKRRTRDGSTEVTALAADVEGKTVVIYDDMIRTGGSLIGAGRAFRDAGAASISAACTHGVFPKGALERLEASGIFDQLACTDTYISVREQASDFLHVEPIAPLLADHLMTIHGERSDAASASPRVSGAAKEKP